MCIRAKGGLVSIVRFTFFDIKVCACVCFYPLHLLETADLLTLFLPTPNSNYIPSQFESNILQSPSIGISCILYLIPSIAREKLALNL